MTTKNITFFDMFSGVGGFRAGLERAGGFTCIGHCEIDKHADRAYRAVHNVKESEAFYEDARKINPETMPEFDLLCAGFPCQSFSIAGKRRGFEDQRGTLFFDIARVLEARHPALFLLENVPGLLSHDGGRTFSAILSTLSELGYGVEWQVLNSKDFGVPQSRKRVYIVGYLDARCAGKILPLHGTGGKALVQVVGGAQGKRVYDAEGLACTQLASSGGGGGKTGLYLVSCGSRKGVSGAQDTACTLTASYGKGICASQSRNGVLLIKEATKRGYKEAGPGDSVDISYASQNQKRARVGRSIAYTLTTNADKAVVGPDMRIRCLTPRECLRLQGFTDSQIDRLLAVTSDSQAYKQAGNAVTVNVIHALGLRLKAAHAAAVAAAGAEKEDA
ncbi:DNA (cytosine-5-)-methyltransferase [Lachnospiraceae bacterium 45-W7]